MSLNVGQICSKNVNPKTDIFPIFEVFHDVRSQISSRYRSKAFRYIYIWFESVKKTLPDGIGSRCNIYFLIPDWLIFDQSGSRKMAGFLKNLMTGKWSALSIYPNVFFIFHIGAGSADRLDLGHPTYMYLKSLKMDNMGTKFYFSKFITFLLQESPVPREISSKL